MYFTGRFDAALVLIHLNPKLSERTAVLDADFDTYVDRHRRFGYYHWEKDPTYSSQFDHKQVRFLRPFEIIDFLDGDAANVRRRNAALALDEKLQLELVPYASPTFRTQRFAADLLRPHFERVLGAVGGLRAQVRAVLRQGLRRTARPVSASCGPTRPPVHVADQSRHERDQVPILERGPPTRRHRDAGGRREILGHARHADGCLRPEGQGALRRRTLTASA